LGTPDTTLKRPAKTSDPQSLPASTLDPHSRSGAPPSRSLDPIAAVDPTPRRRKDLLELSVGYLLILSVLWASRPWQRPLYCAAVVWIFAVTCISFDGWKAMGLGGRNFWRSLWVAGLALLLAVPAMAIAIHLHTLHAPGTAALFLRSFWGYALWSLVQQFLLNDFFLLRFLRLLPSRYTAVLVTVSLFALAHLPNPILTAVTFVFGTLACLFFLRYRNIYSLGIAHAILGICLAIAIPGPIIHNMRVGLGYLTYSAPHPHQRNH
jgi:membrane protease YdiL (CAAX protease family)